MRENKLGYNYVLGYEAFGFIQRDDQASRSRLGVVDGQGNCKTPSHSTKGIRLRCLAYTILRMSICR